MLQGILQHECLSLLIAQVELIRCDIAKKIGVFLLHVFAVVREGCLYLSPVLALELLSLLH